MIGKEAVQLYKEAAHHTGMTSSTQNLQLLVIVPTATSKAKEETCRGL